jgi:thiamine-phosphate pyrophosphorylase
MSLGTPHGLYAIVDVDLSASRGVDPVALTEAVLTAGPALLQLRAKHLSTRDHLDLLQRLAPLADSAGVPLFANDRPDLAVIAGCRGVHVGQDDVPVAQVRRFAPQLAVGVSTHTPAQLTAALADRPDYVAYGPIFDTMTKERPDVTVGVEGLAEAWRLVGRRAPLVAIGGIDVERARSISGLCDCVAVVGGLLPGAGLAGVAARARGFREALGSRAPASA